MVRLNLGMQECSSHQRKVWVFSKADWVRLKEDFSSCDWSFLETLDADEGADRLTDLVLSSAAARIPQKQLLARRSRTLG
jgi:hypothetical protein